MRMDCVFGSMNGKGETIDVVVETYEEWERKKNEKEAMKRKRYDEMVDEITGILGEDRVGEMKSMTAALLERDVDPVATRQYVKSIIRLYYDSIDVDSIEINHETSSDDSSHKEPEIHFLYIFSELVVLLHNELWREAILAEVETVLKSKENKSSAPFESNSSLPELKDDELEEKFVRGSGSVKQIPQIIYSSCYPLSHYFIIFL